MLPCIGVGRAGVPPRLSAPSLMRILLTAIADRYLTKETRVPLALTIRGSLQALTF